MATELPKDMISDILSRLPVKSLIRFRCVCRSWPALLKNSNFITHHSSALSFKNRSFIFQNSDDMIASSMLSNDGKTSFGPVILDTTFLPKRIYLRIVGSCNGIVCLYVHGFIFLWNPATREFRNISATNPISVHCDVFGIGFAFFGELNDYVLVRIAYDHMDDEFEITPVKVSVYSRRANAWREMEAGLECMTNELVCKAVTNGAFHWVAHVPEAELAFGVQNFVLAFNVHDEEFHEIMLPDFGHFCNGLYTHLTVLNDSLSVIVDSSLEPRERCFHVWVMNQYGVEESWTEKFTIGPYFGLRTLLTCQDNDELLLEMDEGELAKHGLNTGEIRSRQILRNAVFSQVFIHIDSLIPINFEDETDEEVNL